MSFKYERFLIEAIEQCQLQKIITCIKHGHNIHIQNTLGQNLLVHLIKQQNFQDPFFEKKRLNIFQFLIKHCNLDVHAFDHYGKNLFNWTANLNCTQEALYLLRSYPGDINILIRDTSGLCSLHYAIEHGNKLLVHAIVDYLLQYRMRFDIHDNHDNTPDELAKKLGYDELSEYLAETSRLTIFMSREIPFFRRPPSRRTWTMKSEATIFTTSNMTTVSSSSLSSTPTSFTDSPDSYRLLESKIEAAKNANDWKTVSFLRSYQRNPNGKKLNQLSIPMLHVTQTPSPSPLPIPLKAFPINRQSTSTDGGQSGQMLHLIEPQLTSSYRRAFLPYYQRPIIPMVGILPSSSVSQRKVSIASSTSPRRMSIVSNIRQRESNVSQLGLLSTNDALNRLSLPPAFKQKRTSITPGRTSDTDALSKLRSKTLITVEN